MRSKSPLLGSPSACLYAKARAAVIKEFTGMSDRYEEPTDADVTIDTTDVSPQEAANIIVAAS
jgi:sulfate adenylyltransferase